MVKIKAETGEDMLTLKEIAELMGVHYNTAWKRCHSGKIPYVKDGGVVRIPVGAFDRYLRSHSQGRVVALQESGGVQ